MRYGGWVMVVAGGILAQACATVQPSSATGNAAMIASGTAERTPDLVKLPVQRYALLVGVSAYPLESGWTALAAPPNDVEVVARVLKANAGFEDKNVRVLSDLQPDSRDRPTRLNVLKAFSDLSRRAAADNGLLLFYFAGHGEQRNGRSYLVPSDGDFDVPAQSIDVEADLRNEIERNDLQQAIMFIDACRSEGPREKRGAQLMTKAFTKGFDFPRRSVAVVFASSSGQASWESPQNGYFGRALADGLAGEAADDDGRITLGTLIAYVQREVPMRVQRERGELQEPESVVKGFQADSLVLSWGHRPMGFVRVGFSSAIPTGVNVQVFVDERIVSRESWESVRVPLGEHDIRGEASEGPPWRSEKVVVSIADDTKDVVLQVPLLPRPVNERSGRWNLVGSSAAFGLTLGIETDVGLDSARWEPLVLGTAAGIGGGLLAGWGRPISLPQAKTFETGWEAGTSNGMLWAGIFGGGQTAVASVGIAGGLAGGLVGGLTARQAPPTEAQIGLVRSGALWGATAGLLGGLVVQPSCSTACLTTTSLTMDVAIAGTTVLAHYLPVDDSRVNRVDWGATGGTLTGLLTSVALTTSVENKTPWRAGSALAGLIAGAVIGYKW